MTDRIRIRPCDTGMQWDESSCKLGMTNPSWMCWSAIASSWTLLGITVHNRTAEWPDDSQKTSKEHSFRWPSGFAKVGSPMHEYRQQAAEQSLTETCRVNMIECNGMCTIMPDLLSIDWVLIVRVAATRRTKNTVRQSAARPKLCLVIGGACYQKPTGDTGKSSETEIY